MLFAPAFLGDDELKTIRIEYFPRTKILSQSDK